MHSHKVNIREHSVHDWWMVCLNKGWILSHNDDWSVNMTLNKNDLFEVYRKSCVGESYGRLMFWTHFHRLVQFVDQTNMTVDIHSLPKCRIHLPKWNRWNSEHKRVFASSGLPQVDVNSVHNWWNVCLANGRITGLKTDGWKDGEMTVSKKEIFGAYDRQSVGRHFGILMFWKHLKSVLEVSNEDHASCVLPSLSDCRSKHLAWESEHNHLFMPTHVLGN